MGKRTGLYFACLIGFPFAFAGFVVGFGCPVWLKYSTPELKNSGLWQECFHVFKGCDALDFDDGRDWMIGVRAVEIFALVMLTAAAAGVALENYRGNFGGRKTIERIIPGCLCCLGGLGGLAGVIVFTIKMVDFVRDGSGGRTAEYGWAMMLVSIGSGLAFCIGVGFSVSGFCLENIDDADKTPINAYGTPDLPLQGPEMFEMNAFTNSAMVPDGMGSRPPSDNHLPSYPYNHPSLQYRSLPPEPQSAAPSYTRRGGPPSELSPQYYSYSGGDKRVHHDPQFDLSEGYLPSHSRPAAESPYYASDDGPYARRSRDFLPYAATTEASYAREGQREEPFVAGRWGDEPYVPGRRGEDPYSRGIRGEDPYINRTGRVEDGYLQGEGEPFSVTGGMDLNPYPASPVRSGYPTSYKYLGRPDDDAYVRGGGDASDDKRDSFYRPGRF